MNRRWELDLLRGFMLVMMFITHLPTRFSIMLGQPFGYVSAAEGFVVLSAFMAGSIYTKRAQRYGIAAMRHAFFIRTLTVYICHGALLLFLFFVIADLGLALSQPALINLLGYYLSHPREALPGALLLIYNPPLLDILPLYILLLLLSPFLLTLGMKKGWVGIFISSGILWFCAQFPFAELLYSKLVSLTNLQVPFSETGAFETYAWQSLWIFGLWLGSTTAQGSLKDRKPFSKQVLVAAAVIAITFLFWRHAFGQVPIPGQQASIVNRLFDKWHLGPLRMLNFFALLVLVMHFGDWLTAHVPRIGYLEKLGAASLPVFCVHLGVVLVTLSVVGEYTPDRPLLLDGLLVAMGLTVLYVAATITLRFQKEKHARTLAAPCRRKDAVS